MHFGLVVVLLSLKRLKHFKNKNKQQEKSKIKNPKEIAIVVLLKLCYIHI